MTDLTMEKWKQVAIEIGDSVYRLVNTPDMVGTDDETGYVIMFFNVKRHAGKSTVVSSLTDRAGLKKIFKTALREIDGPKTSIVDPPRMQ